MPVEEVSPVTRQAALHNEWYLRIEGELIADSILGRVASACRYLDIEGPNMRKWLAENRPGEE